MTHRSRLVGLAVLATVVAAPATASAFAPGVPKGQLETTTVRIQISGSAGNDQDTTSTTFLTAKRGHVIAKNADGSLRRESSFSPKAEKSFDPGENTITIRDGDPAPPIQGAYQEAANFKSGVDEGCFTTTSTDGTKTTYELIDGKSGCSEPGTHETVVYDSARKLILSRVSTDDGSAFKESETLVSTKTVPRTAQNRAQLKLDKHPGAQIIDERS